MKPSPPVLDYFPWSLQLSARSWQELEIAPALLEAGPASSLFQLRLLSERLRRYGQAVPAGRLHALALLNRVFRFLAGRHLEERRCRVGAGGVAIRDRQVKLPALTPTLSAFVHHFPPAAVCRGLPAAAFLQGRDETRHRRDVLIELFLLATQTANPAAAEMVRLFDDSELTGSCPWRELLLQLDRELHRAPAPGLLGRSLLELLRAPLLASPHSLGGQLAYIRRHWLGLLPDELLTGIDTALDVIAEEEQPRGGGPGPLPLPRFGRSAAVYDEPERFSPDADWMPNVVLLAKSVYVWLDQLGRRYGRSISRLDQIPEEELELLLRRGFTGLWLIGLWERSPASQRIKQIMGNPEAVASAYSLYDYAVARDLGGEEALAVLQERCARRGIRLACDVVPNHTGLYSRWVREHPEWYIQVDHPPYPAYRFTGPDLSADPGICLQIDDGYWRHTDAAVVFRHEDRESGRVRFLYHGNDGTHLPWNDTAQLNFLLPEVREAMIRTILDVARRFRIIRFDAAMTLAKKHFQRLWFPQPGGGAGVPSRAEHAMSREEFDRLFPEEFWRQVVDRVAAEVPDTLLLAEAFWLMEGYFVRTLGMHRVYNSAFMNMLKLEENAKYRGVLKDILEFNHEILGRFVNFMSNPDEATAVAQFGTGDKYFATAVLLATLPGLPMFAHGQVEGYREKYGMEFRRAYRDEQSDEGLVAHHESQIFPLLRRRHLFSGSEHFVLYDFWSGGGVNEDVFAFSNRRGGERALVVCHNRHADTGGWVRSSVAKRVRTAAGSETMARPTLAEALGLGAAAGLFHAFRDHRSGLEYLRAGSDLADNGLHLLLGPFQYHVFLDFREIVDSDGSWGELCRRLDGAGAADLDLERRRLLHAELIELFARLVEPAELNDLAGLASVPLSRWQQQPALERFRRQAAAFTRALADKTGGTPPPPTLSDEVPDTLAELRRLLSGRRRPLSDRAYPDFVRRSWPAAASGDSRRQGEFRRVFLPWLLLRRLDPDRLIDYLLLDTLRQRLGQGPPPFDRNEGEAAGEALLVRILVRHQEFGRPGTDLRAALAGLFAEAEVKEYLGCNWFDGVEWFNRERLETLLYWLVFAAGLTAGTRLAREPEQLTEQRGMLLQVHDEWLKQAAAAHYRLAKFLAIV